MCIRDSLWALLAGIAEPLGAILAALAMAPNLNDTIISINAHNSGRHNGFHFLRRANTCFTFVRGRPPQHNRHHYRYVSYGKMCIRDRNLPCMERALALL